MESYAYQAIVEDLIAKISSGTYVVGERLPTIDEFCSEYDVSKITVRRAMDELAAHGLISRQRGAGTFVKALPMGHSDRKRGFTLSFDLHSFTKECIARGMVPREIVNSLSQVTPPTGVAQSLALTSGEMCHRVDRTLMADGVIWMVEIAYIPVRLAPDLTVDDGERSLFAYLQRMTGQRIASAYRRLRATQPDEDLARQLNIGTDEPILELRQTFYLQNGRPVEESVVLQAPGYEFYTVTQIS